MAKGQIALIGMILLAIVGVIMLVSIYSILAFLKLPVTIVVGIVSFFYVFSYLRKIDVDKWIAFGLSFLVASSIIAFVYQSWIYIATLLFIFLILYAVGKYFGFDIIEFTKEQIKEMEAKK